MEERRKEGMCYCSRRQFYERRKKLKEQCKRKRQTFVFNPEEEVWHEPYMQCLRKEFSEESILCDSKIELPWKDIALPAVGMKIRQESSQPLLVDQEPEETELEKEESTGEMVLPWQDLLVTETISLQQGVESCGSSLEIPWSDLAFDKPVEIRPLPETEVCDIDEVEIPWEEIMVPRNIVIESDKKRKHPSSRLPPRESGDTICPNCGNRPCCRRTRTGRMFGTCT